VKAGAAQSRRERTAGAAAQRRWYTMQIVLLSNPLSGRGKAGEVTRSLLGALHADGHRVRAVDVRTPEGSADLRATLAGADCLVCVGGDGTMHHALDDAVDAGVPMHLVPLGTENLFARQFGMGGGVDRVRDALRAGRVHAVDVGELTERSDAPASAPGSTHEGGAVAPATETVRPFAIMVSVGPDASVVNRLAAVRRGPISHLSYVAPGLKEALRPRLSPITLRVDGRTVLDGRRGLLVIANSRQYALRLDPARDASMTDGLLDVVFYPAESTARVLAWGLSTVLGRHTGPRARATGIVHAQGAQIEVEAGACPGLCAGASCQADGEALGESLRRLVARVRPRALRVLLPAV
jgi:diacylglycerol kinase (ATP)